MKSLLAALLFALLLAPASSFAQPDLSLAVRALAVRDDAKVFYAGSPAGLHESRDELRTWRPLYMLPAGQHQPGVEQVIVHPSDNNFLLVNGASPRPTVWLSRDGGATWRQSSAGLPAVADSMELFQTIDSPFATYLRVRHDATDLDALYRTDDRGGTWWKQADLPVNAQHLTVNLAMPELLFVNSGPSVWRSVNGGADWNVVGRLPFTVNQVNIAQDLVSDPANPTSLIATANGSRNFTVNGLFQSLDQGVTWSRSYGPTGANRIFLDRDWPQVFGSAIGSPAIFVSRSRGQTFTLSNPLDFSSFRSMCAVLVDPRNSGIVYVSLPGPAPVLFRSADSGESWRPSPAKVLATLSVSRGLVRIAANPGDSPRRAEVRISALEDEDWALDYQLQSDASWLTFESAAADTSAPAVLFADPEGLALGEHRATVTVSSQAAANAPLQLEVVLFVGESGAPVLFSSGIVNAGGFSGGAVAPAENVSIFGADLASETAVVSSLPLPASLAGTSVEIADSSGVVRPCVLFFVSTRQINCNVDSQTALGVARLTVRSPSGTVAASIEVVTVAPGVFSANASGTGVAAASAIRVAADGAQTPVSVVDLGANPRKAVPIDLGPASDTVVLLIFGTGFRNFGGQVEVIIGGQPAQVLGLAAQPEFVGLDQINAVIPRGLIGAGEVAVPGRY